MILVDTSLWIAHFRKGTPVLVELLRQGVVLVHPFVVGEVACGNLRNRARILADLQALPSAASATDDEVMRLIEDRELAGLGIGWIDGHLLAASLLSNCQLWTLDRPLVRAAEGAGVKLYQPVNRRGVHCSRSFALNYSGAGRDSKSLPSMAPTLGSWPA